MEASTTPDWLKAHQSGKKQEEKPKIGNPQWRKGMKSPNPSGRPKGIVDKRMRANQAMLDRVQEVIDVVIENALGGDTSSASLLLSRVMPAMRAQAERVEFDFDANAPLAEQVASVLQAIADGKVSVDIGKQVIEAIGALGAVKQIDELEERLSALEGR